MSDEIKVKLILDAQKAQQDARALADSFAALTTDADAAAVAAKKYSQMLAEQAREQERANQTTARAHELLQKGIGGGELAEKIRDVSRGLSIAGNASNDTSTRVAALAGSFGIAARAATALASQIYNAGESLSAFSRAAHQGAQTELSLLWERAKIGATEFAYASERLAESLARTWLAVARNVPVISQLISLYSHVPAAIGAVTDGMNALAGALGDDGRGVKPNLEGAGEAAGHLTTKYRETEAATHELKQGQHDLADKFDAAQRAARGLGDTLLQVKQGMHDLSFATRQGEQSVDAFLRIYSRARDAVVGAANERENRTAMRSQLLAERRAGGGTINGVRVSESDITGITGGGSGRGAHTDPWAAYRAAAEEIARAERARDDAQLAYNRIFAEPYARAAERRRVLAEGAAASSATMAAGRAQGDELASRIMGEARTADRERRNRNDLGGQFAGQLGLVRDEMSNTLRASQTFAEQFGATMGGAFNTATRAASAHFAALIEGRESAGEALRGFAHDVLMAVAQEAFVKAIFNTAQGFAYLASYQYPQATAAFTAAGIYAGVAALAGLGGALTTAPSQAQASLPTNGGGARDSARVAGANDNGRGNTVINVTYSGTIYSREHASNEVVAMINDAVERGVRPRLGNAA